MVQGGELLTGNVGQKQVATSNGGVHLVKGVVESRMRDKNESAPPGRDNFVEGGGMPTRECGTKTSRNLQASVCWCKRAG